MRVNREVRVQSDPLSSSFLFIILSALSTLRKLLHTLHSRMSEILGISGWASRMDCSGHCNHREWHQLWCSSYRDCTCKLVQPTGFRWSSWKQAFLNPFPLMKQFFILLLSSLGAAVTCALMIYLSLSPCQYLEWLCFFLFSPIRPSRS